jgi:hypothetical protein
MERLMGKAEALTSTPYQTYPGQRTADASALQEQSYATVGGMQTGPDAFGAGIGAYMSPYQQNVTDIQKREAVRQSDIQGQGQQARAAQAGAFGGYREAIERAERERNLGQNLDDIQAKGSQSAFDRATSQYNTGQQQTLDVAGAQNKLGTQQQMLTQQDLNQQYQDFLNQKQQPYKDLGFMKDILSGSGSASATTQYGAAPNTSAQTAGLITAGIGALGKKDGGAIEGYAEGGIAGAPNDIELQSMLTRMSDEQLRQLAKSGKYDPQVIQQELQRRAQIRAGGIAGLPAAQDEYADGGIIGFADGGDVPDGPAESDIGKWWRAQAAARARGEAEMRADQDRKRARMTARIMPWEAVTPSERAQREAALKELDTPAPMGMDSGGFQAKDKDTTAVGIGAPAAIAQTPPPSIGAVPVKARPTAKSKTNGAGIASILKPKEEAVPASPASPASVTAAAGSGFVPDDYAAMGKNIAALSKERDADTKAAYQERQAQLKAERDEIKGRDKQNINDALIRAGLGMMVSGGQGKSTMTAIGEGATQGFGAYQDAKKLDAAALKANQNAQDLLMQAERAERSGNMRDAAALYAQARSEKTTAAQLEMQARQLAAQIKHQEESLKVQREGHRVSSGNAGRNPQLEIFRELGTGDVQKGFEIYTQGKKEPMSRAEAAKLFANDKLMGTIAPTMDFESYYRMMSGAAPQTSGAKYNFNDLIK